MSNETNDNFDDIFGTTHTVDTPSTLQEPLKSSDKPDLPPLNRQDAGDELDVTARVTTDPEMFNKDQPNKVTEAFVERMDRIEEIENEILRTEGRYIEAVDNVKPGMTMQNKLATEYDPMLPMDFIDQSVNEMEEAPIIRSDGVILDGHTVFDPARGAKKAPVDVTQATEGGGMAPMHDPRSDEFLTCVNKNCEYRQNCLRYRLSSSKPNKFAFFPESCRKEGIFIDISETDYSAYPSMDIIESTSTPSF